MKLTVLQVAYPFAPVGPDAIGGAEQVLSALDIGLAEAGHRSIVIGCEGSVTAGPCLPVPRVKGLIDEGARANVHRKVRLAIATAMECWRVNVIHFHGVDCTAYVPDVSIPKVVTLHCPVSFFAPALFQSRWSNLSLICVSDSQRRSCSGGAVIPNGVPEALFRTRHARRGFALAMGRVCPEKNFHAAFDAARIADVPVVLAGEVFPYAEHMQYYESEIAPRLNGLCRHIGPVGMERKRRLLSAAQCLLLPSLAPETSSLVAMEALACGTPVVAYPSGALADLIVDGKTGYLVDNPQEMAEAMRLVHRIDSDACRESVRGRFHASRMIDDYLRLYHDLAFNFSPRYD